jgi:hypothetical protein
MTHHSRRGFLGAAAGSVAALSLPRLARAAGAPDAIQAEIAKRHDESLLRLQQWIREPSIAAENRGMDAGCETMLRLAREAGFGSAVKVPTAGHPGVFATRERSASTSCTTSSRWTPPSGRRRLSRRRSSTGPNSARS